MADVGQKIWLFHMTEVRKLQTCRYHIIWLPYDTRWLQRRKVVDKVRIWRLSRKASDFRSPNRPLYPVSGNGGPTSLNQLGLLTITNTEPGMQYTI